MEHVTLLQIIYWSLFIGLTCIGALTLIYLLHKWILDKRETKRRKKLFDY